PANDRYCPDRVVTRGQMAAFLSRALHLPATTTDYFNDDNGHLFENAINQLAAAGITQGCNPPANSHFCPDRDMTRGQMAAMLARAFHYSPSTFDRFTDDNGHLFENAIQAIAAQGVTVGCNPPANTHFCPDQKVTRDQMATFLTRALGLTPNRPPDRLLPLPGNPDGHSAVPTAAREVDTSSPDHVVGSGTPQSCTSQALVAAVAQGGIITFDCGPDPVTILMTETARVFNDTGPEIVIDGGGLVTLSGGGQRRILYMNTCDPSLVWTTSHCQNQDHPSLTVQNINFVDGDSTGDDPDGGGAIWVRGGRFKIVNSVFARNQCDTTGPDVGGASVRVFSQYNGLPVYVVNSTFGGGPAFANSCSNSGGISSIGVSWTVINSLFTDNETTGWGANPQKGGTPGGGNGGAIYLDGNTMTLRVQGTRIEENHAREGGGGIFFVSNDRSGYLIIEDSVLRNNPSDGFETIPGIFYLGHGPIQISNSVIEG
ncbi:MAG: S-layer homology domain-containing protein, partial [Acidimicrobiia bacterium]